MKVRRVRTALVAMSTAVVLLSGAGRLRADDKADQLAHELIAALGGESAWEKARQLRFDFVVERDGNRVSEFRHVWDRYTGDYRVTGTDKTGAPFAVYFNVNTKDGKAFSNGRPVEGEEKSKLLELAYGRFINDTYWLLAPWKIFDPGVHREYDGEKTTADGALCDVLKLSFENVGLTPKDIYWLWITRDGHRMVQWQYLLGGAQEEPMTAYWKDWRTFGGMSLSTLKTFDKRPVTLRFDNVAVTPTRDDKEFSPP